MRTTKRGKFAAIAVGLALVVGACSDDKDTKTTDTTTANTGGGSTTVPAQSGGTVTYAAEQEYTAYNNASADQVLFANTLRQGAGASAVLARIGRARSGGGRRLPLVATAGISFMSCLQHVVARRRVLRLIALGGRPDRGRLDGRSRAFLQPCDPGRPPRPWPAARARAGRRRRSRVSSANNPFGIEQAEPERIKHHLKMANVREPWVHIEHQQRACDRNCEIRPVHE